MSLHGTEQMIAKLVKIAQAYPDVVGKALYQEGEIEMTEAKRRTPVDTGALRATGVVNPPERNGSHISVTLTFGTLYAVFVHEDLEAFHKIGQAKFLESTLQESASHMAERVGKRILLNGF